MKSFKTKFITYTSFLTEFIFLSIIRRCSVLIKNLHLLYRGLGIKSSMISDQSPYRPSSRPCTTCMSGCWWVAWLKPVRRPIAKNCLPLLILTLGRASWRPSELVPSVFNTGSLSDQCWWSRKEFGICSNSTPIGLWPFLTYGSYEFSGQSLEWLWVNC